MKKWNGRTNYITILFWKYMFLACRPYAVYLRYECYDCGNSSECSFWAALIEDLELLNITIFLYTYFTFKIMKTEKSYNTVFFKLEREKASKCVQAIQNWIYWKLFGWWLNWWWMQ